MSPTRGVLRLGRAAALGASCLALSLTGHVLAGGSAPSPLALLALVVPVACLAVLVTGQRAGLGRITATLGLTQVGLHEAFMLLAQPHCSVSGMAGHGHGPAALTSAACAPGMQMAAPSGLMLVAHVMAGVGTALLLWHGERLLWALVTRLAGRVPPAIEPPLVAAGPRLEAPAVRRVPRRPVTVGGVGRRGPPVLATA